MTNEKVYLESGNDEFYLDCYVADKIPGFVRNAVLIIPGGGYSEICAEREGEPIALEFLSRGYNAFVLHYSVGLGADFPKQLREASLSVCHIRENADKYGIDPEKVFAVGFSAGGHLAASLGTMWDREELCGKFESEANKIAGMMLIYPVISPKFTQNSFKNLLNEENLDAEKLSACDILNYVSEKSCPAFIMHSANDEQVNVKNSLALAEAFSEKGLSFELHIYPDAPHGVALGNEITKCGVEKWCNPRIAKWVENAVLWAKDIKK